MYHIPLSKDGLRIHIATLSEQPDGKIYVDESMVDVPFGDGIIIDAQQIHSGHYSVRGNTCLHGIFSEYEWKIGNFLHIKKIAKCLFPNLKHNDEL